MKRAAYLVLICLFIASCTAEGEISSSNNDDFNAGTASDASVSDKDSESARRTADANSGTSGENSGGANDTETGGVETSAGTGRAGTDDTETGGKDGTGGTVDTENSDASTADGEDASVDVPDGSASDSTTSETSNDSGGSRTDSGITGEQIIADHSVVDRYDDIPTEYINEVKKMWINIPGESHSSGYRHGLSLLAASDSRFPASVTEEGDAEAYRDDALRISRLVRNQYNHWAESTGEENWYTNTAAIEYIKNHIQYCQTNNLEITAIGFGWCWDMTWHNNPGGGLDPVYKVHWAGSSEGGPDGDMRWGLDADDHDLTGNTVSMDTYLDATQQYVDFCAGEGYATKVLFTTGPVDGSAGENGYQRHLKQEHIRQYVRADSSRILFDYADILAWSDSGEENLREWVDGDGDSHSYQLIHDDNMLDLSGSYAEDGDHIGERGALRLGKAIWWILARIAGWDGE